MEGRVPVGIGEVDRGSPGQEDRRDVGKVLGGADLESCLALGIDAVHILVQAEDLPDLVEVLVFHQVEETGFHRGRRRGRGGGFAGYNEQGSAEEDQDGVFHTVLLSADPGKMFRPNPLLGL